MSELSREDQAALRRAEVQQVVEAASEKIIAASNSAMQELERVMEQRFSAAHSDLKTHTIAIHGIQLDMARIQGAIAGMERDILQNRTEYERQFASMLERHETQAERLTKVENLQASRSGVYNQMERVLMAILLAAVAALTAMIGWTGGPG